MAKGFSKYDLIPEMKSYMLELISKSNEFKSQFRPVDKDFSDADIIYVRNQGDFDSGLGEGISYLYKMQKYKIKPQEKLRVGTKHYYKKYYKNGVLEKVESYCDGELQLIYYTAYNGTERYLIPFGTDKKLYPTYVYTIKRNGNVIEEYCVNRFQILYSCYYMINNQRYEYLDINYAYGGSYPVLGCEIGEFEVADVIKYTQNQNYSWYMEFNAERKGRQFKLPNIPHMIKIK